MEEFDDIIDLPITKKQKSFESPVKKLDSYKTREPERLNEIERKRTINNINNHPKIKPNGILAMSRTRYYTILILLVFFAFCIIANIFWFNFSISSGKAQGNVTVNNEVNVDSPTVPITIEEDINNNFTINIENKVIIDEDEIDRIIEEVIGGINE